MHARTLQWRTLTAETSQTAKLIKLIKVPAVDPVTLGSSNVDLCSVAGKDSIREAVTAGDNGTSYLLILSL